VNLLKAVARWPSAKSLEFIRWQSSQAVAWTRQAASGTSKPSIVDNALAMQSCALVRSSSAIATRAFTSQASACHVCSAVANAIFRKRSACGQVRPESTTSSCVWHSSDAAYRKSANRPPFETNYINECVSAEYRRRPDELKVTFGSCLRSHENTINRQRHQGHSGERAYWRNEAKLPEHGRALSRYHQFTCLN